MRKYQQLLLIIISAFSLLLLLVYRHEYNRLRYVLEVFNFFGQPCNYSELINNGNMFNHHDWGPEPIWTQEDNIYIYSSHLAQDHQAKSLIVKPITTDHPRNCYLWFESNEWKPEVGKFTYQRIFTKDSYEGYHYTCSWSKPAVPYAITYSKQNQKKNLINLNKNTTHQFKMTMCVPPSQLLTKRFLSEFISYHALVGVDSFIIYSTALPHKTIKLVTNLSTQLKFNISFYPYNFPEYFEEMISEDCKLRTSGESNYSLVMDINEYLVPRTGKDIYLALKSASDKLRLPINKFCINEQLAKKPMPLQNVFLVRDNETQIKFMNVNNVNRLGTNLSVVDNENGGLITVQKYVYCLEAIAKVYEDDAILKFSDDFIKSTLFQMNVHNLL